MKKSYFDCLKELSPKDLYVGLLGYGLFNAKIPDIFTSKPFYDFCSSYKGVIKSEKTEWVSFENNRNNSLPRTLGIPNPFSYQALCITLKNNWNTLLNYFEVVTKNQKHKNSRVHIRKIKGTKSIFEMSYNNFTLDGQKEPNDIIDSNYIVKTDISKCFESIYTHAIAWALVGKRVAKANKDKSTQYQNTIDRYTRLTTNDETHGLLIGPTSSNVLSEIILSKIDEGLQRFKYYRTIDDYVCFTKTLEEANDFIVSLKKELNDYGLSLNDKKTSITKVSENSGFDLGTNIHRCDWILEYKKGYSCIDYKQIVTYFDAIAGIYKESDNNASTYCFAFKLLSNKTLSKNAREYYINKVMHLAIIHPYLLFCINDAVFLKHGISFNMDLFCKTLYSDGLKERNFEKSCYGLYFAIQNGIDLINKKQLLADFKNCDDCVTMLMMWLYYKKRWKRSNAKEFEDRAKLIIANAEMDLYWVFVYEVLGETDLSGMWKTIKKAGVSFIDMSKISTRTHWKTILSK